MTEIVKRINPEIDEDLLILFLEQDKNYIKQRKISYIKFTKKTMPTFKKKTSFKDCYLSFLRVLRTNAIIATITTIILIGGSSAFAMEAFAPEKYKPSTLIENVFDSDEKKEPKGEESGNSEIIEAIEGDSIFLKNSDKLKKTIYNNNEEEMICANDNTIFYTPKNEEIPTNSLTIINKEYIKNKNEGGFQKTKDYIKSDGITPEDGFIPHSIFNISCAGYGESSIKKLDIEYKNVDYFKAYYSLNGHDFPGSLTIKIYAIKGDNLLMISGSHNSEEISKKENEYYTRCNPRGLTTDKEKDCYYNIMNEIELEEILTDRAKELAELFEISNSESEIIKTEIYTSPKLSFEYPSDWKLTEKEYNDFNEIKLSKEGYELSYIIEKEGCWNCGAAPSVFVEEGYTIEDFEKIAEKIYKIERGVIVSYMQNLYIDNAEKIDYKKAYLQVMEGSSDSFLSIEGNLHTGLINGVLNYSEFNEKIEKEADDIIRSANNTNKVLTHTNQYYPDLEIVYDDSWEFETRTVDLGFESKILKRYITLSKNNTTLEIELSPNQPGSSTGIDYLKEGDIEQITSNLFRIKTNNQITYQGNCILKDSLIPEKFKKFGFDESIFNNSSRSYEGACIRALAINEIETVFDDFNNLGYFIIKLNSNDPTMIKEADKIIRNSTFDSDKKTYTNQYYPDLEIVYDDSWEFETETVSDKAIPEGYVNRIVFLRKEGVELRFVFNLPTATGWEAEFPERDDGIPVDDEREIYRYPSNTNKNQFFYHTGKAYKLDVDDYYTPPFFIETNIKEKDYWKNDGENNLFATMKIEIEFEDNFLDRNKIIQQTDEIIRDSSF